MFLVQNPDQKAVETRVTPRRQPFPDRKGFPQYEDFIIFFINH